MNNVSRWFTSSVDKVAHPGEWLLKAYTVLDFFFVALVEEDSTSIPLWWPLTVAVRILTLTVSKEAICSWELGGWWLVCQDEQCSDAEHCGWGSGWAITGMQHQTSWYHLSVHWQSARSKKCLKGKGVGLKVCEGFVCLYVWLREWKKERKKNTTELTGLQPWNMLQSFLNEWETTLTNWHGKNTVPK